MDRPIFYFDGTCRLCRAWAKRWRRTTGEAVEYRPFADGEARASSEFVDLSGTAYAGAEGVFRLLATTTRGRLLWCYRHVPLFAPLSELAYKLVSSCRVCAYELTKWFMHE